MNDPRRMSGRIIIASRKRAASGEGNAAQAFLQSAHQATLDPLAAQRPEAGLFMWSEQQQDSEHVVSGNPTFNIVPRRVVELHAGASIPDWRVVVQPWTKGIVRRCLSGAALLVLLKVGLPETTCSLSCCCSLHMNSPASGRWAASGSSVAWCAPLVEKLGQRFFSGRRTFTASRLMICPTYDEGSFMSPIRNRLRRTNDERTPVLSDIDPVRAEVALLSRVIFRVDEDRVVWAGSHAGFAADADRFIKVDDAVRPLEHRRGRARAHTGCVRAWLQRVT